MTVHWATWVPAAGDNRGLDGGQGMEMGRLEAAKGPGSRARGREALRS